MYTQLSICLYIYDHSIAQTLTKILSDEPYRLHLVSSTAELLDFVDRNSETIDCLIILRTPDVLPLFNQLYEQGTLLPAIILESEAQEERPLVYGESPTFLYHSAEVHHRATSLTKIREIIDHGITQFLHLGPSCSLSDRPVFPQKKPPSERQPSFLLLQQRRLAEKLKERLGYLGVYYKRNPKYFYRNLSQGEKQELIRQLKIDYREILLNYFGQNTDINQEIDQFVNQAFFADISVSQVLEIHMELMDEFSQQLKLEGRSEEILLDYRLTVIDVLAHLGEMYRRSIPRGDILFDLLYH